MNPDVTQIPDPFTLNDALTLEYLTAMSLVNYEQMDELTRNWFYSQVERVQALLGQAGVDRHSVYISNFKRPGWPRSHDKPGWLKQEEGLVPFDILEIMALTENHDRVLRDNPDLRKRVLNSLMVIRASQVKKRVVNRAFAELVVLLSGKLLDMDQSPIQKEKPPIQTR